MAADPALLERVRAALAQRTVVERKMFGGVSFMVNGNMVCAVNKTSLLVRLSPEEAEKAQRKKHVEPMAMGGRTSKGFFYVAAEGIRTSRQLAGWLDKAQAFVDTLPKK